jgi:Protein of unknown function (DUF3987)
VARTSTDRRRPFAGFTFLTGFLAPRYLDWVLDIAERKQCPTEYVAIPAIAALGTALGSKVEVRPKRRDDWANTANFWGIVIGRPGMLKSPAIDDVVKPLRGLEREARVVYNEAMRVYEVDLEHWEAAKKRDKKDETDLAGPKPEKPLQKRYLTSDTTYEMLGVMMSENPGGVLVHRDELIYLLLTSTRKSRSARSSSSSQRGTGPRLIPSIALEGGRSISNAPC